MLLVALTGNYGMGKSTVLQMFRKLGVVTLDSDSIVESLLGEQDVIEKIQKLFGDEIFNKNGSLNRSKISDIIFKSDVLRSSLEDILHPLVFERIKGFLDGMNEKNKIVVIEVPILYERGYEDRFDRTIVVYSDEESALNRLEKDGINRGEAVLRLKAQLPVEGKITKADFIIDNSRTIEETMAQVETVYKKLLEEAKDGNNQRS